MAIAKRRRSGHERKGRRTVKQSATSPRQIKRRERMAKAIELRLCGYTMQQIAVALKVSPATAYRMVDEAMNERVMRGVEEYREITLGRLEALLSGFFKDAVQGDARALSSVLRIIDQQRSITGMDPPVQVRGEIDHTVEGAVEHSHDGTIEIVLVPATNPKLIEMDAELAAMAKPTSGSGDGGADAPPE